MIGEDLSPFFVAGEFSDMEDRLAGAPVGGIFDAAYSRVGGGLGMATTHPAYHVASAAVPADVIGAVLIHKNVSYAVIDVESDGTGLTVLIMEQSL